MNPNHRDPPTHGETRRAFIQRAAATAATVAISGVIKTPVYGQNQAPSTGRVLVEISVTT